MVKCNYEMSDEEEWNVSTCQGNKKLKRAKKIFFPHDIEPSFGTPSSLTA